MSACVPLNRVKDLLARRFCHDERLACFDVSAGVEKMKAGSCVVNDQDAVRLLRANRFGSEMKVKVKSLKCSKEHQWGINS